MSSVSQRCFVDVTSRPFSDTELLLRLPIALTRLLVFVAGIALYTAVLGAHFCGPDSSPRFTRSDRVRALTRRFCRLGLRCVGLALEVRGEEHAQQAAESDCPLLVCNHISYFDVVSLAAVLGPFSAVGRSDLTSLPLLGRVTAMYGILPVSKSISDRCGQGVTAKMAAAVEGAQRWDTRPPLLVFAEGTTTNGSALALFKTGAFVHGRPVLPVCLRYSGRVSCAWLCRPPQRGLLRHLHPELANLLHFFCTFGSGVQVTVLPVHTPCEQERGDPGLYAERVRADMARTLSIDDTVAPTLADALKLYT